MRQNRHPGTSSSPPLDGRRLRSAPAAATRTWLAIVLPLALLAALFHLGWGSSSHGATVLEPHATATVPGDLRRVASAAGQRSRAVAIAEPTASEPPRQSTAPLLQAGAARLSGRVSDVSGGPVAGASITARGSAQALAALALSDSNGHFELRVASGEVELEVAAEGYAAAFANAVAPAEDLAVGLVVSSTIVGIVVARDTLGPTPRVSVSATNLDGLRARAVRVTSDAEGKFRIERLAAGTYALEAVAAHWRSETESLQLTVGATSDPIQLVVVPATALSGSVRVGGQPCASGYVELSGPSPAAQRLPADGQVFLAGLLPGTYRASIECEGAEQSPWAEDLEIARDPMARVWELLPRQCATPKIAEAPPAGSIQARIVARDREGAGLTALAIGTSGTALHGKREGNRVVFDALPLDAYQVYLERAPNVQQRVTLSQPGLAQEVQLEVPPFADLSGQVIDVEGLPVPDAWVRASTPTAVADAPLTPALTDAQGEFVIRGRLAGPYVLTVESAIGTAQVGPVAANSRSVVRVGASPTTLCFGSQTPPACGEGGVP